MKKIALIITLAVYFSGVGISQGTMGWVILQPGVSSGTNGNCTSMTDCASDVLCFGLQYTPSETGTLTSYTTGFFTTCTSAGDPVTTNVSCVMADNSEAIVDCPNSGLVLFNSSGNSGDAVNNSVTMGVPSIIHQVCFTVPAGETITITEDPITDLTTNIDLVGGGSVTDFPNYSDFVLDRNAVCLALPVELISFDARKEGQHVELRWETASEINNSHFDVERSLDGSHFEPIGQVKGSGTTSTPKIYGFVDVEPKEGKNYYRLKQVDFDSRYNYTPIRQVEFGVTGREGGLEIKYFPNPVIEDVSITANQELENHTIRIVDIAGKIMVSSDYQNGMVINMEKYAPGAYTLQIVTAKDEAILSEILIKQD